MTRIGSLCSGYGGLDLALEAFTGGRTVWHVEYDKHPSAILAHRWPDVPNYGDVKLTDWTQAEPVDWLTAGYPCQPFSHAGNRKGSDDSRHLWPGVAHAIRVLRPRRVLLENVAGHLSLGFGPVLGDLAALGYDTRWLCLRAADAGAPHNRARVFIVATDAGGERHGRGVHPADVGRVDSADAGQALQRQWAREVAGDRGAEAPADADDGGSRVRRAGQNGWGESVHSLRDFDAADADEQGPQGREPAGGLNLPAWGAYEPAIRRWESVLGRSAPRPTEPGRNGQQRLSPTFVEWMMGLSAGWVTDVPGLPRNAQLKALGNGVVPQQALLALRTLSVDSAEKAAS